MRRFRARAFVNIEFTTVHFDDALSFSRLFDQLYQIIGIKTMVYNNQG